uniref:Uncharacterized protein n=1 Tax=Lepeophtheirus salmonis TaxID=72036 RepID=A0A0K2SZS6_LEPSM
MCPFFKYLTEKFITWPCSFFIHMFAKSYIFLIIHKHFNFSCIRCYIYLIMINDFMIKEYFILFKKNVKCNNVKC